MSEKVTSDICAQRKFRSDCAVWSESSLGTFRKTKDAKFFLFIFHINNEQTANMHSLIWDFVARIQNVCNTSEPPVLAATSENVRKRTSHHENIPIIFWPPLTPLLYSKTGVCRGVHYFCYFCSKYRLWYSLEPPRWGGSNEYPQSMFWAEIWSFCIWKFSLFGGEIFYIF